MEKFLSFSSLFLKFILINQAEISCHYVGCDLDIMGATTQPLPSEGEVVAKLIFPSYASILGTRNKIIRGPTEHRIGIKDIFLAIYFSPRAVDRAKEFMKGGLILKLPIGQRPPLNDIGAMITRDWNIFGEFTLGIVDHRHVLMKVEVDTEVIKVLTREKTHVKGYYFQVSRWSLDFDPKRDSSIASLWIKIPGLRLHQYHPDFLEGVAEAIVVKFLKADEETIYQTRAMGARICIEVDLLKQLPDFIFVAEPTGEGYWQRVKYPKNYPAYGVFL